MDGQAAQREDARPEKVRTRWVLQRFLVSQVYMDNIRQYNAPSAQKHLRNSQSAPQDVKRAMLRCPVQDVTPSALGGSVEQKSPLCSFVYRDKTKRCTGRRVIDERPPGAIKVIDARVCCCQGVAEVVALDALPSNSLRRQTDRSCAMSLARVCRNPNTGQNVIHT